VGFTDRDGTPVEVGDPPAGGSLYGEIGAFQGPEYRRNAFAQGTEQEAEVLRDVLQLRPGARVLDVGCGNGRHVAALQRAGIEAVGLDLSPAILQAGLPLVAGRAQHLPFPDDCFDAVISVCQGGFGINTSQDERAVGEWCRVLRTGGRVALTAFSLVFAIRYMGAGESIDVERGLHHHLADVRGPDGDRRAFDLWTAAYSVPHLALLLDHHGFDVDGTAGVEPGAYQRTRSPSIDDPEVLIWAVKRRSTAKPR
jgi:SAM-dependent methyltransferase